MRKLMNALLVAFFLLAALVSCAGEEGYPYIEYRNSYDVLDHFNRKIFIEDSHILDEGHSYDIVETEAGYDIVLHIVRNDEGIVREGEN